MIKYGWWGWGIWMKNEDKCWLQGQMIGTDYIDLEWGLVMAIQGEYYKYWLRIRTDYWGWGLRIENKETTLGKGFDGEHRECNQGLWLMLKIRVDNGKRNDNW